MSKLKIGIILFAIFCSGYFLRVMFLPQNSLTFGYDQARDAYHSLEIAGGHLKILGPPASTPGLYHGVFYYYLLAPAYLVGHGSPVVAAYWIAFLNSLTIIIIFYLSFLITKDKLSSLFAGLVFAVSFESSQYALWLSNPTIGVWTVPLIYLGLWAWINKEKWLVPRSFSEVGWPIVTALGLGLSIQSEIFLAYHAVPIFIWLFVSRKEITRKQLVAFVLSLVVSVSTMIISEIKFGFRGILGFKSLFFRSDPFINSKGALNFIDVYLNQIGKVMSNNLFPLSPDLGKIIFAILIAWLLIDYKRSHSKSNFSWQFFLLSYLVSHIIAVPFGGTSTPFIAVGIGSGVAIAIGILLSKLYKENKIISVLLLLIILSTNVYKNYSENYKGQTIFSIQKDMLLSKQIKAIDYIYLTSQRQPFSVDSVTSPLWINIVWTYLFKWYGLAKYNYLPEWHGRDQIGQLDSLSNTSTETKQYFLILEPPQGIPEMYINLTISEEDSKSTLIEEQHFGDLRIQKRIKKTIN